MVQGSQSKIKGEEGHGTNYIQWGGKQALTVNKNRSWLGGETLPKGTVCLLKISEKKNNIGVKELPVVITGLHYYSQSGNIRYKVASKDGFISGTFSRGG
jgi:hypothetical protein